MTTGVMDSGPTRRRVSRNDGLLLCLALLRGLLFRRFFLRRLLRHFLAFGPCLGQADRDRLFAALYLPARTAALQRPRLALLHHAFDVGGGLLGIFSCHDYFSCWPEPILASDKSSGFAT